MMLFRVYFNKRVHSRGVFRSYDATKPFVFHLPEIVSEHSEWAQGWAGGAQTCGKSQNPN